MHSPRRSLTLASAGAALLLLAIASTSRCFAEADLTTDFNNLDAEHQHALGEAAVPINHDYQTKLAALLERSRQAKDVDLSARIQQALDRLAATPPSIAALGQKATYLGQWEYLMPATAEHYALDLLPDGTWSAPSRHGNWVVSDNQLVINFDLHREWHDHYDLPIKDGVLQGKNSENGVMQLTRRGVPPPPAVAAEVAGTWKFHNYRDGVELFYIVAPDGTISTDGKRIGYWLTDGEKLFVYYDAHREWHDVYTLPVTDGVLRGHNMNEDTLTLTQVEKAGAPPSPTP